MPIRVQTPKHGIVEFPDGTDEATMSKALQSLDASEPSAPEPGMVDRMLADNPALPGELRAVQGLLRGAKAHPVTAGAMIGGTLTAPLTGGASIPAAMAAAGLGAAGGAGAAIAGRQLATGVPESGMDTAKTMLEQGAAGAAGEGGGRGLMAVAAKAAPIVAKSVLRVAPSLQKEYGLDRMIQTFLNERIPVGQSTEAGTRMSASASDARDMAAAAEAAGAPPVSPWDSIREFRPVGKEIANRGANARPGVEAERREVVDRAKGLLDRGPVGVTRNQELKQSAQSDANSAFRAQDRGAQINDTTAKLDKAIAVGRQKAAETRVPGIKDVNKRTQDLMGLESVLEGAQMKSSSPLGWNPIHAASAMFPGASSHAAFGLQSASKLPFNDAFKTALLAALMQGQEQK